MADQYRMYCTVRFRNGKLTLIMVLKSFLPLRKFCWGYVFKKHNSVNSFYSNFRRLILFEDDHIIVVHKPANMLSVPGYIEEFDFKEKRHDQWNSSLLAAFQESKETIQNSNITQILAELTTFQRSIPRNHQRFLNLLASKFKISDPNLREEIWRLVLKHDRILHRQQIQKIPRERISIFQLIEEYLGHQIYSVHRLDQETSGVILFAKNTQDCAHLCQQFSQHSISKHYLARVGKCSDHPLSSSHPSLSPLNPDLLCHKNTHTSSSSSSITNNPIEQKNKVEKKNSINIIQKEEREEEEEKGDGGEGDGGGEGEGEILIDLPLRADWENRPRQVVDWIDGKPSLTRVHILSLSSSLSSSFFPSSSFSSSSSSFICTSSTSSSLFYPKLPSKESIIKKKRYLKKQEKEKEKEKENETISKIDSNHQLNNNNNNNNHIRKPAIQWYGQEVRFATGDLKKWMERSESEKMRQKNQRNQKKQQNQKQHQHQKHPEEKKEKEEKEEKEEEDEEDEEEEISVMEREIEEEIVLEREEGSSLLGSSFLLRLSPITGRSHQLRVHLSHLGYPILGDSLYSPPSLYFLSDRLLLHAEQIEFTHPRTGERMRVRSEIDL